MGIGLGQSLSQKTLQLPVVGEIAPSNLKIWLKRGESQVSSSGSLSAWSSTSPADNNFSQGRGAQQPSISGETLLLHLH